MIRRRASLTLVTITDDHNFIVVSCKFDMTVSLFLDRVQRSDLVFTGIPVHFQELLFLVFREDLV